MSGYWIDLPGVNNARELGGRVAGDRLIRRGVLLRSGRLNGATPEALERLKQSYRVQTVVDFRMSAEQLRRPDPEIPGASSLRLPTLEPEDMALSPELIERLGGPESAGQALRRLMADFGDPAADRMATFSRMADYGLIDQDLYAGFLLSDRGRGAYRAFFEALINAQPGRAVLWHCDDGKDRAGCAAMLVLFALGANREAVMADYLLTNEANAAKLNALRARVAPLALPPERLQMLLFLSGGVAEGYMSRAIRALEERCGSVEGYLAQALGVGEAERRVLREKYTEI